MPLCVAGAVGTPSACPQHPHFGTSQQRPSAVTCLALAEAFSAKVKGKWEVPGGLQKVS